MTLLITQPTPGQRGHFCMSTHPYGQGRCICVSFRMRLDEWIPLLVHLAQGQSPLPLWWQTHKLCQADCRQKTHSHIRHQQRGTKRWRRWQDSLYCDRSVPASVGVVDYCVERLIDPLPEQHSWSCPTDNKVQKVLTTSPRFDLH